MILTTISGKLQWQVRWEQEEMGRRDHGFQITSQNQGQGEASCQGSCSEDVLEYFNSYRTFLPSIFCFPPSFFFGDYQNAFEDSLRRQLLTHFTTSCHRNENYPNFIRHIKYELVCHYFLPLPTFSWGMKFSFLWMFLIVRQADEVFDWFCLPLSFVCLKKGNIGYTANEVLLENKN